MSDLRSLLDSPPTENMRVHSINLRAGSHVRKKTDKPQIFLMIALSTLVLVAPVPLASNHPVMWLFWATAIGIVGSAFFHLTGRPILIDGPVERLIVLLGLAFLSFGLLQSVPFLIQSQVFATPFPTTEVSRFLISSTPTATLVGAVRVAGYLGFFVLVLQLGKNKKLSLLAARILFTGVAAHALWAMISLRFLGDGGQIFPKTAYFGLATGTFVNKNSFATFLGMGLILGLCLLKFDSLKKRPDAPEKLRLLTNFFCVSIVVLALFSTQSRMGIASCSIAVSFVLFRFGFRNVPVWASVCAVFGSVAVFLSDDISVHYRLAADAWFTRIELYRQVGQMIFDRPIFGSGLDSFPVAFQKYHAPPVTAEFVWDKAHSTYLTLWSESGVIFGTVPPLAGALAAKQLWQKSNGKAPKSPLATAALGALLLCGLHSMIDFSLEIQANTFLLLALVGLGMGLHIAEEKERVHA